MMIKGSLLKNLRRSVPPRAAVRSTLRPLSILGGLFSRSGGKTEMVHVADITGNTILINASVASDAVPVINDTIESLLSSNAEAGKEFMTLISATTQSNNSSSGDSSFITTQKSGGEHTSPCVAASILYLLQSLGRHGGRQGGGGGGNELEVGEVTSVLEYFESLNNVANQEGEQIQVPNKLSLRDSTLVAGSLAWQRGQYMLAGTLFETSLLEHPADPICLQYAQKAYIAAGRPSNALACVVRCPSVFDCPHELHAHILGMLARGFVENGRMDEAERVGLQAVEMSKGHSCIALQALLSVYHLTGRSSEMVALLDEHSSKHTGSGLSHLLYLHGTALIMRGNYSGALKFCDALIEQYVELSKEGRHSSALLENATMLLWQLQLNDNDMQQTDSTSSMLSNAWSSLAIHAHDFSDMPLSKLCHAIVIAKSEVDTVDVTVVAADDIESHLNKEYRFQTLSRAVQPDARLFAAELKMQSEMAKDDNQVLHAAFISFAKGNYKECAERLLTQRSGFSSFGSSAIFKDILYQTEVEAMIRSGDLRTARVLLTERSVLLPNNGQTWRRLAVVHDAELAVIEREAAAAAAAAAAGGGGGEGPSKGDEESSAARIGARIELHTRLSKQARYNAWQLGIGQGGFGGPK